MGEVVKQIKPVQVNYVCDECSIYLIANPEGAIALTDPPRYEHICKRCGRTYLLPKMYPFIKYIDK